MKNKRKNKKVESKEESAAKSPDSSQEFPALQQPQTERRSPDSEKERPEKTEVRKEKGRIELKPSKKGQRKGKVEQPTEKTEEDGGQFRKRKIVSNWERYEEKISTQDDEEDAQSGADYSNVLDLAGKGSHFQFKSEASWGTDNAEVTESYFSLDTALLVEALNCVPLHLRLKLNSDDFTKDMLKSFNDEAFENAKVYYEKHGKHLPTSEVHEVKEEEEIDLLKASKAHQEEKEEKKADSLEAPPVIEKDVKPKEEIQGEKKEQSPSIALPHQPQEARQKRERRPRQRADESVKTEDQTSESATSAIDVKSTSTVLDVKPSTSIPEFSISDAKLSVSTIDSTIPLVSTVNPAILKEISEELQAVSTKKPGNEKVSSNEELRLEHMSKDETKAITKVDTTNAPAPQRQKKQRKPATPEDNLDYLLTLKTPLTLTNRENEESDEEAEPEELKKAEVTVTNITQPETSASLEDWLDSILDD